MPETLARRTVARSDSKDVRCRGCNTLLGRLERGVLTIRRNQMQIDIEGRDYAATLQCYVPHCRARTVVGSTSST